MLAAVEGPAKDRAAVVDGAAGRAEIDTLTVCIGGEQEHRIPGRPVGRDDVPVGVRFVASPGVKEQTLIAPAALGAAVAGDFCLYDGLCTGGQALL